MSDCKDLLGALSEYLDGNEQSEMCAALRQHMAGCEKCRVVVNSAKKTIELYRESDQVGEIPVDSKLRLHRALHDAWMRRQPRNPA
jgi:predicted anti-sigma-YlaC factor YlaD